MILGASEYVYILSRAWRLPGEKAEKDRDGQVMDNHGRKEPAAELGAVNGEIRALRAAKGQSREPSHTWALGAGLPHLIFDGALYNMHFFSPENCGFAI